MKRSIIENGEVVADVYGETEPEVDQRARLYQTAPELLEALKVAHEAVKGKACSLGYPCQFCELIAKAEGK